MEDTTPCPRGRGGRSMAGLEMWPHPEQSGGDLIMSQEESEAPAVPGVRDNVREGASFQELHDYPELVPHQVAIVHLHHVLMLIVPHDHHLCRGRVSVEGAEGGPEGCPGPPQTQSPLSPRSPAVLH
ncbi:hypothetical protein P7K49_034313 [Saguinus oedipus]|uniref:Uncharacterized protein n=1 Tax=Saguinus oedipus TaxID=9490 RepID=A0ABQ9TUD8_SAGOE|nr:hypothetical protein P7K49_034313 [Saguinus oedipus]